jgi:uncharacterized membrane protein
MEKRRTSTVVNVLALLGALLVCKVTLSIVLGYRDYLPPDFNADFLLGRESYFWGRYSCAFYAHLVSGPLSLLVGTVLISEQFRSRFPTWHRRLGRLQVACVLLFLAPSGLWMAFYAISGAIAAAGLGTLAIATAACVALGWRAAVIRRFGDHRRWMQRAYVLLCSAVVIRIIGGLATVAQWDALWIYSISTWGSWLVPLLVFESVRWLELSPAAVTSEQRVMSEN